MTDRDGGSDLVSPSWTRAMFGPEDIGRANPKDITDALLGLFRRGPCAKLARVLVDRRWFQFILTFKGAPAQIVTDRLQYYADELTDSPNRRIFVRALIKMSKSSGLYPGCLLRTDIQLLGTCPVSAGGFGEVWKGTNAENKFIAAKILKVYEKSDLEKLLKEASSEIVTWRQLSHPNVLAFHGVWHPHDDQSRVALISPWMEQGNLVQHLRSNPTANRFGLILDIAEGLKYLHESKPTIIHGDLKGVNILINPMGSACLADFGLASAQDSQIVGLTSSSSGRATGTCRWQAPEILDPELFDNNGRNTRASDIYSFACVCYEVYSGNFPFYDIISDYPVMFSVTRGQRPPKPPSEACKIRLNKASQIWDLIEACWAQSPKRRLTAGAVVEQLRLPETYPRKSVSKSLKSRWAHFTHVRKLSREEAIANDKAIVEALRNSDILK